MFSLRRLRRRYHEVVCKSILVRQDGPGRLAHVCICGARLGESHYPESPALTAARARAGTPAVVPFPRRSA